MTFISGIPGLEDFHFGCGRHNSASQFKEFLIELTNHVIQTIDYDRDKFSTIIPNIQMDVIVIPEEVADNVASMTLVRHKMWLGDWKAISI